MNLRLFQTTIALFIVTCLHAQTKPLTIGDTVPNIEIRNIINYPTTTAHLADFKGKLLILDFWATWCSSCIAMFPRLDTLEKSYPGKLTVLGVTDEASEKATDFFDDRERIRGLHFRLTSITDDSILNRIFPHTFIPHYVWISDKGVVIAITDRDGITSANIKKAIGGGNMDLELKKDTLRQVDVEKPLFVLTNPILVGSERRLDTLEPGAVGIKSVLTKHISNVLFFSYLFDSSRISVSNAWISKLYEIALSHRYEQFFNKIRWEVKDSSLFHFSDPYRQLVARTTRKASLEWGKSNMFCYELELSDPSLFPKKYEIMLGDLNRYFGAVYGIEGGIKKRKVHCLILDRTVSKNELRKRIAAKNSPSLPSSAYKGYTLRMRNKSLDELTYWYLTRPLEMTNYPYPLVNETGYFGSADLDFKCDFTKITSINRDLEKYGLKLVEGDRDIDVIVIKDAD